MEKFLSVLEAERSVRNIYTNALEVESLSGQPRLALRFTEMVVNLMVADRVGQKLGKGLQQGMKELVKDVREGMREITGAIDEHS